jgi:hypothetical protein
MNSQRIGIYKNRQDLKVNGLTRDCTMHDKKKKSTGLDLTKNKVEEPTEQFGVPTKNDRGEITGNCVNISEDGVSLYRIGDSIYELLFEQLSSVANEIIAEIELSDDH